MSAQHTLYKQFCHTCRVLALLATALFGAATPAHAGDEVMVSVSSLYDIMPPEASIYKETPEKFFVVNINNPQDHTLTVYLTMKIEKISGDEFVMEQKVSAMPQSPMFAITLPASTSVTLSSTQLHNHFRHLSLAHFNITGTLLGNVLGSNFGLLPEGDYKATLTAYEYIPGEKVVEKTKSAISDPSLSSTQFKICYKVKPPILDLPFGVVKNPNAEEEEKAPTFSGVDYDIPDINFNNTNTWNWLHLMEVCGQLPNMNYELEFYSMKNGSKGYATSPENAIVEVGDRVLLYPGTIGPKLINVQTATFTVPNPKSYFQEGEYYAVRVHAKPVAGTSGTSNTKMANYRMYENDGYSPALVIRAVYEGQSKPDGKKDDKKDDKQDDKKDDKKKDDAWKTTVTHPKLTFPDNEGNCFGAVYIEANKDYEATWERPEFVEGDEEFAKKLDYTYNINIYKAPADAATFEEIVNKDNTPLYSVSELKFKDGEPLKHKVPWQKLMDDEKLGISLGGHYFIEVTANPVPKPKEGQLLFCARGQNCCTYTMYLTEDILYTDCDAIVDYPDKEAVSYGETIEKKQAEFNGFHVVFTNLKATDEAKKTYAGTGYVKWQPLEMSTYIAMSFTGIRLNKSMQVIAGSGSARKMANSDVIPYELIDYAAAKAGNWVKSTDAYNDMSEVASTVGEAVQQSAQWVDGKTGVGAQNKLNDTQKSANAKVQQLYDAHVTKWRNPDEVAKACGDYWTQYIMPGRNYGNTALNWFKGGSYDEVDTDASPTFLPIGLPQSFLPDSLDMDFQVMKFELSTTTASVGVAAFFYMPDAVRIDKAGEEVKDGTRLSTVLAFVAPRLCVKPQEIWAKEGEFGLLYDFSIKDVGTGYTFTFLAPTDYTRLNDGCAIHWEQVEGKTKCNMLVLDAKMSIPGLLNEDRSRMAELRLGARIDNWSDWMAWITMDAFQLEDLDGYVFNVTGKNGIRLDHSRVKNPDLKDESGSPLTISSLFKDVRRGDDSGQKGYDWSKLGFQKVPEGKDPMNWMGLYVDEISMTFPKSLNITDKADAEKTSLKLGLRNLLWDKSGVSLTAFVGTKKNPVVSLETGRLGGWALSLEEVAVNVLQSKFSDCHFNGMFRLPLLDGSFDYECKMNYVTGDELGQLYKEHNIGAGDLDEKKFHLTFTTKQHDEMKLNFWLGDVHIDENGSWLNLDYLDGDTQVEFMASGTVTLGESNDTKTGGKVGKVPFDIPGVRFAGLRMANYKYDTNRDFAKVYAEKLAKSAYKGSKSFNQNLFQTGLNKELSEADFEGSSVDYPFYFNIGRWSLASEEKKMWGFPLRVKDLGVETDSAGKRIGLKITGEIGLVGGGKDTDGDGEDDSWALTAGAGMTIWAKYEFKGFKDLADASISYDGFTFNKLYFNGSFGGGIVTVNGELTWEDNDETKGFQGELTLGVKELFDVTVAGGIWEMKKENYKSGYFYVNAGEVSIPCGPTGVIINRLSCGFFWNRTMPSNTKLDDKEKFCEAMAGGGIAQNKCFGLTFGLGLAFANETLCSGDFNGFMAYDLKNDALSRLTLLGDMDALKGPEAKKGLLGARVKIDYIDNVAESKAAKEQIEAGNKNVKPVERCQSFTLSVTVDFKADTKKALEQFLGEGTISKLEGTLTEAAKKVKESGMDEFSADKADEDNKGDGKTSGKDGAKSNLTASAGVTFSLEFQLRHYPDTKQTKWHVYLGEPSRKKRCEFVYIDFRFESKLLTVWAKEYVNAYLCLGNELPKDENGVEGGLPALPDKLIQILDGKDKKSSKNVESTGHDANLQAERAKQIQSGPSGAGIKGGIQFGAEAGAEFGVQIPIGYVNVGALLGFDAVLKQYGDCACSDGSQLGGKNGFYAMAQVYAALWGAAGVSLDFGFWRGDFPLVDVAFGAVLKGGFPNPSWVYGKMRVKGEVLGGLISFNKAMELRMGKVCVPEVGSPLDNIDIFSSYTVGSEDKNQGWGSKGDGKGATLADPYVMPSFTTNMDMDSQLLLVDENEMNTKAGLAGDARAAEASSTKAFVFHLERNATLQAYSNSGSAQGAVKYCDMTPAQNNRTSFTVNTGSLNQYQNYKLHIRGYVKQIIDGREQNPIIRNLETHKDEQKEWGQNLDLYFRTDKWSDDLSQEVMLFMPFDETGVILQDAANPYFSIANPRSDMFNSPDKEWYVNLEVNRGSDYSPKWRYPDLRYDASGNRLTSEQSKWEHVGIELTTEYEGRAKFYSVGLVTPPGNTYNIEKNTQYRFSLYCVDKKQMNDDLDKIKEARKSVASGKADVLEALTLLAYDEDGKMTDLGKDMMAWYTEMTSAKSEFSSSKDEVEQAIVNFQKNKMSDLRYTSLEFQRVFKTGTCNTFAQKLNSTDYIYSSQTLKFRKSTVTRRGGTITARMKAGHDQLSSSINTNPYWALNWWANTACVPMMPCYRFTAKYGDDEAYYMKNASLIVYHFAKPWHGNPNPPSLRYTHIEFEKMVSPFYATTEWRTQSSSSAISGRTICKNMVDSVGKVLYADGRMAADLPSRLRTSWNKFEDVAIGKGGRTTNGVATIAGKKVEWKYLWGSLAHGWDESGSIKDLREYNQGQFSKWTNNGYFTAFKSSDTYFDFPLKQMCCILTCDVHANAKFKPIWDQYVTRRAKGGIWSDTYLNPRHTWPDTYRRGATNAIYWIAGERSDYFFSMSGYLATIKKLTFEVRRPTGYDANSGKYSLRPSTRFGNTVDMAQSVSLHDYGTSVRVDQNGTPTMTEDNSVHFDDANFEKYILAKFDRNGDGKLSKEEALQIGYIKYNGREKGYSNTSAAEITNLHGIEAMTNLESLIMDRITLKNASDANLSNNKKLRRIEFTFGWTDRNSSNGVSYLPDLSGLPALDTLNISHHYAATDDIASDKFGGLSGYLDVSTLSHLKYLALVGHRLYGLTGLDKLTRLEYLDLRGNQISTLDATSLPRTTIYVGQQYKYSSGKYKPLTTSDKWVTLKVGTAYAKESSLVSSGAKVGANSGSTSKTSSNYHVSVTKYGNLKDLIAQMPDHSLITYIAQTYKKSSSLPAGYTLDDFIIARMKTGSGPATSKFFASQYLNCFSLKEDEIVKTTTLNVADKGIKTLAGLEKVMPNLNYLNCNNNELKELDLTVFPGITNLYCSNNHIVSLTCTEKLYNLVCLNNALTTIDLSRAKNLAYLYCNKNALTELVLANCQKLKCLECQHNQLKSLDASKCANLVTLDCSYNTNMTHMGTASGALWVALYVPQSIEKLVARGIYVNDGFGYIKLNLPNLTWLDMSENPTITNYVDTKSSAKLKRLDLHETSILRLMSETKNLTYLDLSKSNFTYHGSIDNYYVRRFDVDMYSTDWRNLKNLDVSDTKLNRVYVRSYNSTYILDYLYAGAPNRKTGNKVEVQMDSRTSAKWEKTWKNYSRNKYAYAHVGNGSSWDKTNSENMKMESLSTNDETMRRNFGEKLYNQLKRRYSPDTRWLHTYTVSAQVKELDCSGQDITDIDSIILWTPNLEKLDCSHNFLKKANFTKLAKLRELRIGRNPDLTSLSLPNISPAVFDVIDVSETKLGATTVNNLMSRCKKFIASGVKSLTGTLYARNYYPLTYLDVQHTNIEKADLYCPTLETFKANYCQNLTTVLAENGAKTFKAVCGGVNGNVEVRLYNQTMAKKWFDYSGGDPLNENAVPTYKVTFTDGKESWAPVASAEGAVNLANFCKKNINSYRFAAKGKDVTLTLFGSDITPWYANSYYLGNDNVHVEFTVNVAGTIRYCPVTSLQGARDLAAFARTLTSSSQLNVIKNELSVWIFTLAQLNQWFETLDDDYATSSTVKLRLVFKDSKALMLPVAKWDYKARTRLFEFCKKINSSQFTLSSDGKITLSLTEDEKKVWKGQVLSKNRLIEAIDYSEGNDDVRLSNFSPMIKRK